MPEGFKPHPLFARLYMAGSSDAERRGQAEHRDEMLAGLSGTVVEVGAGNGLNFAHYPEAVERVVAVEPEPTLRGAAEEAAREAPVTVEVVDAVSDSLPGEDDAFDAAVTSLVLCTVDAEATLAEIARVLKPGGELRFYEHVASSVPAKAAFQRFADRTFWPHISGGCHASRDTAATIERAGFSVERMRRFDFKAAAMLPSMPHILGVARVPAGGGA